jgi:hypothetical protein
VMKRALLDVFRLIRSDDSGYSVYSLRCDFRII